MSNKELVDYLRQQCKERRLSLRSLSVNSGLSPGTVHSITKRKYQPTLFTLSRLADYLGVRRQYMWRLAGLLEERDYDAETTFGDPHLRFLVGQADRLPARARELVITIISAIIAYTETGVD